MSRYLFEGASNWDKSVTDWLSVRQFSNMRDTDWMAGS